MKLDQYLEANGLTLAKFGSLIGRSPATISRIARGINRPDWDTLEAIKLATAGAVTANDFHEVTQTLTEEKYES